MTLGKTGLLIPRRKALLGAATLATAPLAAPFVARAADLNLSLSTSAEYVRVEAVPAAAEAMAPAELL